MNNDETARRGALRSVPRSPATLRSIAISPREQVPAPAPTDVTQPVQQPTYDAIQAPEPQVLPEMAPTTVSDPVAPQSITAPSFDAPITQPAPEPVDEQLEPVALSTSQLLPPPLPVEPIMRPIPAESVVLHPLSQAVQPAAPQESESLRNPVRFQDVLVKSAPKSAETPLVPTPVTQDDLLDESLSFPDSGPVKQPVAQQEKKSFLKRIFKRS